MPLEKRSPPQEAFLGGLDVPEGSEPCPAHRIFNTQHTAPLSVRQAIILRLLPVSVRRVEGGGTRAGRRSGHKAPWSVSSWGSTGPTLTLNAGRMALAVKQDSIRSSKLWGCRHVRGGRDTPYPFHTHLGRARLPYSRPSWAPSNRWGNVRGLRETNC